MWPPCLQSYGYRIVDKLFATRIIRRGDDPKPFPRGEEVSVTYHVGGSTYSIADYMDRNAVAGLLVIKNGTIVLETYGLGLRPSDRWSTMSTVKSMTAMLVGCALYDGAIATVDDPVARYLPQLAGSCYEAVTVRQLLCMSSGAKWSENYGDRESDVNQYSRSLANKVPGGVLDLLKALPRAHAPGTVWNYNTGDTYLLGTLISAATQQPLAQYMSEKIWQPCGMEFDAYYTLESEGGQEIGGSRAGMALRDIGRFAAFVLKDGVVDGRRLLPLGWVEQVRSPAFTLPMGSNPGRDALKLTAYGLSWWLTSDGAMMAMGHCGQRIYIHPTQNMIVVSLAAYPEPAYVSPNEHNRDEDLNQLIQSLVAV